MKYGGLRMETPKERFERLKEIYVFQYMRTTGKKIDPTYKGGYVTVYGIKFRLNEFQIAIEELKDRPDFPKLKS